MKWHTILLSTAVVVIMGTMAWASYTIGRYHERIWWHKETVRHKAGHYSPTTGEWHWGAAKG